MFVSCCWKRGYKGYILQGGRFTLFTSNELFTVQYIRKIEKEIIVYKNSTMKSLFRVIFNINNKLLVQEY